MEMIKRIQFLQSLSRVNPLSDIPNNPIKNIESKEIMSAKIKIDRVLVIIPI